MNNKLKVLSRGDIRKILREELERVLEKKIIHHLNSTDLYRQVRNNQVQINSLINAVRKR